MKYESGLKKENILKWLTLSMHNLDNLLKIKPRAYEEKRACNSLLAKLCGTYWKKYINLIEFCGSR